MGCIGAQEGFVIIAIIVVVMGAGRLPQIGDSLGRSILNFRRAINGTDEIDVTPPKQVEAGEGENDDDEARPA